jgi:hypothetical protein
MFLALGTAPGQIRGLGRVGVWLLISQSWQTEIVPIAPVHPQFTVNADENGHFEVAGRQPGQYIVGVGLLAPFDSAEWQTRTYYPGVSTREQAKVIELDVGEWRTDIDFSLTAKVASSEYPKNRQ